AAGTRDRKWEAQMPRSFHPTAEGPPASIGRQLPVSPRRDAPLSIRVISVPGLDGQLFALHLQLHVVVAGGRAVFIGCIAHAVLGSQFLNNAGVNLADGLFLRDFEETPTRFLGNPL